MITHYFQKTLLAVSDRIRLLQSNNNQASKAFRSLDMFEIGLTTLILLFFIFPIPGLAISLSTTLSMEKNCLDIFFNKSRRYNIKFSDGGHAGLHRLFFNF
jgi:hypothetical protein